MKVSTIDEREKEKGDAYHEAAPSILPRKPPGIGRGWRGLRAFRSLRRSGKALTREKEKERVLPRQGRFTW
jgi:hypothetical protein